MSAVVHRDERRGHFLMDLPPSPDRHCRGEVVGADLGACLHLTSSGTWLSPDEVRLLIGALDWWVARQHSDTVDSTERVVELNDLFDLLPDAS